MRIFSKIVWSKELISDREIKIYKAFFNPEKIETNELLFETIDLLNCIDIEVGVSWEDFLDKHCLEIDLMDDVYVLSYTDEFIVFTGKKDPLYNIEYTIETDNFCLGLQLIVNENNFDFLKENLTPYKDISNTNTKISNGDYPSIIEYIKANPNSFKTVYYPGAGQDFTAFHLFGKYATTEKIFYIDYLNDEPILSIKSTLKNRGKDTQILSPSYFGCRFWNQFWPSRRDSWFNGADWFNNNLINEENSWGLKTTFSRKSNTNKSFDFYYLSTEGIKTMDILLKKNICPDVLVLQDHGYGGNWSYFGDNTSPLYEVMKDYLPEYLLVDPKGNTVVWPGYEQVTQPFYNNVEGPSSMYNCERALFKKV